MQTQQRFVPIYKEENSDGTVKWRVHPEDVPVSGSWSLMPLYKTSRTGAEQIWQIGFNGTDLTMYHGNTNGNPRTDTTGVEMKRGKQTIQEQALSDALGRFNKKYTKDNYRPEDEDASDKDAAALAEKWKPGMIHRWPVIVQPKLDGIRMLAKRLPDGTIRTRSKGNKIFPHLERITQQLQTFFQYFPPNAELDGELYSHDLDFEQLTSAVKTEKRISPLLPKVMYHIFDIILPDNPTYEYRYISLVNAYNQDLADGHNPTTLTIVPSEYASSDAEILAFHQRSVAAGYEGTIVRKIGGINPTAKEIKEAQYVHGRSKNLLKHKDFKDEEGIIVGVEDAGGKEQGAAILVIQDKRGNVFRVRPRGSFEQRREWFEHPEMVMGKLFTFRYQELTDQGVPRFPVGIAVRDYE